jgi:hypothetical protein
LLFVVNWNAWLLLPSKHFTSPLSNYK